MTTIDELVNYLNSLKEQGHNTVVYNIITDKMAEERVNDFIKYNDIRLKNSDDLNLKTMFEEFSDNYESESEYDVTESDKFEMFMTRYIYDNADIEDDDCHTCSCGDKNCKIDRQ